MKRLEYESLNERLNCSGHWHFDFATKAIFWSEGIYKIHGVESGEFNPTLECLSSFYSQFELESIKKTIVKSIEGKSLIQHKTILTQPNGKRVKVECIGEVEFDADGNAICLLGVMKNITNQEDIFEKLKLLSMVNYTIKVPIFFINEKDNIVFLDLCPQLSNESSALFNHINFSITDYLAFKKKAKKSGQIKRSSISFDNYNSVFDLSVTYEADEGIYIWIVENVTEAFRKDQQQIISNRLALLGNTFGNVSHDINNVLGVALGAIEMLEIKVSQGEKDISNYIDRVKNAIDKGKDVTGRLLAFTRKPTVKVIEFDPIEEIKENKHLFKQLLLTTIDFKFNFNNVKCRIHFPQGEFINILLNLVLNAQDAIREQGLIGQIVVSTNINELGRLEVNVKDSGIGIEDEKLSRIFDPFYSSKSVNKGNGIGLANVYNTMYKHNGEIRVSGTSDLGGAEFVLIFKCDIDIKPSGNIERKVEHLNIKTKSVLILDDEKSIAEFIALYLNSKGANTTHVSTKKDLVKQLSLSKEYDIFITDMILPDISGREAVGLVLDKYPDIKVYSISGYIAEEDKMWTYPVLRKPFNSKELATFLSN
ncbi:ATP-binding protein [Colwelliaceae bacterium 6471]